MNGENSSKNEEDCNEFDDVQLVTDALRYAQGKGYRSDCSKNSIYITNIANHFETVKCM